MTRLHGSLALIALATACSPEVSSVTPLDASSVDSALLDSAIVDTQPDVTRPDAAPIDVAPLDAAQPDVARLDATQPDVARLDATQPDAPPLDVPRSDVSPIDAPSLDVARDVISIDTAPIVDRPDVSVVTDVSTVTDAPRDTAVADTATPPPPFTTVFSHRSDANAPDTAIEDAIVDLINRAIPGSRIRVAIFSFTRGRPATALINAHRRGVDVQLVVDGDADNTIGTEIPGLITALGASRVTVCAAPGTSCNGTGIMHQKTFLFSALDDGSRNVVVQASHNLTTTQLSMHNNAVIVRGDAALFAAYERTFNDMRRDSTNLDYYRIDDGDLATRVYFFPRQTGDTAVSIIENASCDSTSRILVAMAFFTDARVAVAQALAARARAGCAVTVVAGDAEIPLGSTVASTLTAARVTLVRYPTRGGSWDLHSKYVVIDAPYAGSTAHRRLVFTGSHNWTGPSLDQNDETLLRIDREEVFNAFVADHAHIRASALRP